MKRHKAKLNGGSGGFTLIELLVVVAIISLLTSIVLVALQSSRTKARNNAKNSHVLQIMRALEMYQGDHLTYPVSSSLSASNPICLGYLTSESCYGGNYAGNTGIRDQLEAYFENDFAHRDPVMHAGANLGGIFYKCVGTSKCNSYTLSWVLEGTDTLCPSGGSSSILAPDRVCSITPR